MWLLWAQYWYNTSWHSATNITPLQASYGRPLLTSLPNTAKLQSVEDELVKRDIALQLLKDYLVKAKERIKKLSKTHRTEREFTEGDWVYLRLQPYRQFSVAGRKPHKLSPPFYGPY